MRAILSKNKHLIVALILSLFCSIISIYNTIPNNDGILYLKTADVFLNNGFSAAFAAYGWPFYSIFIALFSKYSGVSILNSAYILNAILQAGIVLVFLNIFNKFKPTNTQLWFAVLIIIVFPQFNDYRHDILRDFGFWLFCLLGINNLLNYVTNIDVNKNQYVNIILYCCSFGMAFLFRTEALFIAFFTPLGILLLNNTGLTQNCASSLVVSSRAQREIPRYARDDTVLPKPDNNHTQLKPAKHRNYYIFFICLIFFFLIVYFLTTHQQKYFNLIINTLSNNLHFNLIKEVFSNYAKKVTTLNNTIFPYGSNGAMIDYSFFIAGLLAVFILKFIKVFNLFNLICLSSFIYGQTKNQITITKQNKNYFIIILSAVLITIIIPTSFLYLVFITSGRYYLLSALLLLLFVPFGLDHLWQKAKINPKVFIATKFLLFFIIAVMLLSELVSFNNHSKTYIKKAGLWYQQQNFPKNISASNNAQLEYFADISNHTEKITLITNSSYEYFLLNITKKNILDLQAINNLLATQKIIILNEFSNKRGDIVFIIRKI